MAELRITIGPVVASVTAANDVAQALVEQVISHRGGTAQARLLWLLRDQVRRWREETDDLAIRDALSGSGLWTNGGRSRGNNLPGD